MSVDDSHPLAIDRFGPSWFLELFSRVTASDPPPFTFPNSANQVWIFPDDLLINALHSWTFRDHNTFNGFPKKKIKMHQHPIVLQSACLAVFFLTEDNSFRSHHTTLLRNRTIVNTKLLLVS